jgi:hypothetical protein
MRTLCCFVIRPVIELSLRNILLRVTSTQTARRIPLNTIVEAECLPIRTGRSHMKMPTFWIRCAYAARSASLRDGGRSTRATVTIEPSPRCRIREQNDQL